MRIDILAETRDEPARRGLPARPRGLRPTPAFPKWSAAAAPCAGAGPRGARQRLERHRAAHRRDGNRQGGDRPGDPSRQPAAAPLLRGDQLRGLSRHPARERALRPQEAARSRGPSATSRASSSSPTAAPSSSTRSARPRRSLQAKLLRVLAGARGSASRRLAAPQVDVRVVAATNRNPARRAVRGALSRRPLLPPRGLPHPRPAAARAPRRHRAPGRALPRALHGEREARRGCRLSHVREPRLLLAHRWPGNVRELENEMQRALALAEPGELITPSLLSDRVKEIIEPIRVGAERGENLREALDRIEAWLIRQEDEALEHHVVDIFMAQAGLSAMRTTVRAGFAGGSTSTTPPNPGHPRVSCKPGAVHVPIPQEDLEYEEQEEYRQELPEASLDQGC